MLKAWSSQHKACLLHSGRVLQLICERDPLKAFHAAEWIVYKLVAQLMMRTKGLSFSFQRFFYAILASSMRMFQSFIISCRPWPVYKLVAQLGMRTDGMCFSFLEYIYARLNFLLCMFNCFIIPCRPWPVYKLVSQLRLRTDGMCFSLSKVNIHF